MSYILDALRKADADRERDPARGIHAQPVPPASAPRRSSSRVLPWALASAAVLVIAGGLGWQFAPRQVVSTRAVAVAPVPVPAAPEVPQSPAAAAPVAEPPPPTPAAVVLPPAPPVVQVAAPTPPAVLKQPAPAAAAAPAAPAAPAPVAPPAERVFAVTELPADVQQALPKLVITGGVYSENASQRMLIVGGQVVSEGSEIASGLVLEQIRNKTAVLRFRGWRYSVGY